MDHRIETRAGMKGWEQSYRFALIYIIALLSQKSRQIINWKRIIPFVSEMTYYIRVNNLEQYERISDMRGMAILPPQSQISPAFPIEQQAVYSPFSPSNHPFQDFHLLHQLIVAWGLASNIHYSIGHFHLSKPMFPLPYQQAVHNRFPINSRQSLKICFTSRRYRILSIGSELTIKLSEPSKGMFTRIEYRQPQTKSLLANQKLALEIGKAGRVSWGAVTKLSKGSRWQPILMVLLSVQ